MQEEHVHHPFLVQNPFILSPPSSFLKTLFSLSCSAEICFSSKRGKVALTQGVWQFYNPFQTLTCPPGHSSICSFVHSFAHYGAGTDWGIGFYWGFLSTKLASGGIPLRPSRRPHYHPGLCWGDREPQNPRGVVHLISTLSLGSCWSDWKTTP